MTEPWIYDRRPTEDDADENGQVIARHDGLLQHPRVDYREVSSACYWRHTSLWQPPLPTIKDGQTWRRADGVEVYVHKDDSSVWGPLHIGLTEDDAYWYTRSGEPAFVADDKLRLVELIERGPVEPLATNLAPEYTGIPEHTEIPDSIRAGAEPFYVLVVSHDSTQGRGEPIIFETQIPAGSNLPAALRQQKNVGSRYGTTYVAECRIIPELTSGREG